MQWIFPTLGLAEERQEQEVQQEGGVVCGHGAGQGGSGRGPAPWPAHVGLTHPGELRRAASCEPGMQMLYLN